MTLNQDIRRLLESEADTKYQQFTTKLTPGAENILGIRIPRLREIAKDIAKNHDWRAFLDSFHDKYYEEMHLYGMVIGYADCALLERLKYVEKFVSKINNWAVCDCCCVTFRFALKHQHEVWEFIQPYINSRHEYENRFAVVMMMSYFINETYISRILDSFNRIEHNGYYSKMAIAWALSVCMVKFEKQTKDFLKSCSLNDWTFNKTIQKICESYRICPELKAELKLMKRK